MHKQGVKAAREEERAVADRLASSYAHKVEGLWWLVGVQRRVAGVAGTGSGGWVESMLVSRQASYRWLRSIFMSFTTPPGI